MHTITTKVVMDSPRLNWLNPVFQKLRDVVNNYIDWDEEPPYWNNEAASVSMLVAAAARAGCIVLSDYRRDKWDQRNDVNGRCDLLIGKGKNYLEIEAKQIYVGPKVTARGLNSSLNRARADAKKIWWGKKRNRAGLIFAVVSLSKKQLKTFEIERFRSQLGATKADIAWFWHDSSNSERYRSDANGRHYPGFAVLLKF
jgi:hypothetical protein